MAMPCGILSCITCIIYFLCKILVVCGIKCIIILGYIVCIISVNGTMFINNNIINKIITCVLYIVCFICLLLKTSVEYWLICLYVICVIEDSIIISFIHIIFNISNL